VSVGKTSPEQVAGLCDGFTVIEDSLVRMLHDVGFSGTTKVVFPSDAGTWWSDLKAECRVLLVAASPRSQFRSKLFPNHG